MANNVIKGYQVASAQSLAADFQTDPVTVRTLDYIVFNVSTSSVTDNTGEFNLQHRVYKDDNNVSSWSTLEVTPEATLSNTNDQLTLILDPVPVGQVRLTFVAAGSVPDGTCDIWVTGASKGGRN